MNTYVITEPVTCGSLELAKERVLRTNCAILLGSHAPLYGQDPKTLIGDPTVYFTETVCDMLHEAGMLSKQAYVNAEGRQHMLKDGSLLWEYDWEEGADFSSLSLHQLEAAAWCLRGHPNFANAALLDAGYFEEEEAEEEQPAM